MKPITFRMAVRCEAAGRPNNEDNYQVDDNLSDSKWSFVTDEVRTLSDKGALMIVCDGMGGMNAGEVASAIAVETLKSYFESDQLTPKVLSDSQSIRHYIATAIVAADKAIKTAGKADPDKAGMGSTVVLAWIIGNKVYVGWCGDSRAYRYNPAFGLQRLSHDHSYVQELVDAGQLTEELAFDHPNNNIITRSLGNPNETARPDVVEYTLYNGDILLLCSDGLCGTLRDHEIEAQIAANQTSMQACRDALWAADEAAGWHDNVTVALLQVLSGAETAPADANTPNAASTSDAPFPKNRTWLYIVAIVVAFLLGIAATVALTHRDAIKEWIHPANDTTTTQVDSVEVQSFEVSGEETIRINQSEEETQTNLTETPQTVESPDSPTQDQKQGSAKSKSVDNKKPSTVGPKPTGLGKDGEKGTETGSAKVDSAANVSETTQPAVTKDTTNVVTEPVVKPAVQGVDTPKQTHPDLIEEYNKKGSNVGGTLK